MSYIKWHPEVPNVIDEVRCVDCGAVLVKLVRTDTVVERRTINGVKKEWALAVHSATPEYDTYLVDMEDGSRFEVPICKSCKTGIITPEDEHQLVLSGVEAMEDEASRIGGGRAIPDKIRNTLPKKLALKSKGGAQSAEPL
jgi:hypothetical protein